MFVQRKFVILTVLILSLSTACSPPEKKQEEQIKYPIAADVSPEHYRILAENDYLRIVYANWGPEETDDMHSHPPFAAYFLTDFDGRLHYPDGTTAKMSVKAGEAIVRPADPAHLVENSLNQKSEMILVERKIEFPVETLEDAAPLSHEMSPEVYRVIAENEYLRVVEATWQPGQRDLFHSHPPFAAYLLTDVDGLLHFPGGAPAKVRITSGKGMAQYADPSHSFENLSDKPIKMLIVEAK
jgi:quercetin dioxygenase-like cupin family protein